MKNRLKTTSFLNYLSKNLSSLPWSNIKPDELKVNYLPLTAVAKFHDKSVSKKLFSKDEKLKYVSITFGLESITVLEKIPGKKHPNFFIKFSLKLIKENKIKLLPKKLYFGEYTLSEKTIKKIIKDYKLEFEMPKTPYNLRIASISTVPGKLILKLKK